MRVIIVGPYQREKDLMDDVNFELEKLDGMDIEIKYQMSSSESEVLFSVLIIVKNH